MGNIFSRLATLPIAVKVLMVVAALIVLGLSVVLSPLLAVLAAVVLAVAVIALIIQLLRRASLRRWGIIAAASLLLVLMFSGISNALYGGGGQSEQRAACARFAEVHVAQLDSHVAMEPYFWSETFLEYDTRV